MKKVIVMFMFGVLPLCHAIANDGVFRVNGNELMPISNTDISVMKEILSIKKTNKTQVEVSVYYEFFNPGEPRRVDVGFEAQPPQEQQEPIADDSFVHVDRNAPHPYIHNFTVNVNGTILPYRNMVEKDSVFDMAKMYVYLFDANFKKGKNVVQHSYICDFSENIISYYQFDYVLDAARRWAGGTIADFTLIVDMGGDTAFAIPETFFDNTADWSMVGDGKIVDYKKTQNKDDDGYYLDSLMKCYVRQGTVAYHKQGFHPDRNLSVFCLDGAITWDTESVFDARNYKDTQESHIPFSDVKGTRKAKDEYSTRVMRNIPYARRGYVFKDKTLQAFFEKMEWYMPNPNYKP